MILTVAGETPFSCTLRLLLEAEHRAENRADRRQGNGEVRYCLCVPYGVHFSQFFPACRGDSKVGAVTLWWDLVRECRYTHFDVNVSTVTRTGDDIKSVHSIPGVAGRFSHQNTATSVMLQRLPIT